MNIGHNNKLGFLIPILIDNIIIILNDPYIFLSCDYLLLMHVLIKFSLVTEKTNWKKPIVI